MHKGRAVSPVKSRSDLTPTERSMRARIASYRSWANTSDPSARTRPGRDAFLARFEREVDPDDLLPIDERRRRALAARRAYMTKLAYRSARARRMSEE